ncbi:hypothetical protein H0H81_011426 [Sphagnurus paluster]|uniref:PIN domain-containing protein n=1 Tax=Sphagnurus paluster TaxID=117069 RepID=A0A9P7GPL5_9AGAR|nr:hypothetical protein H0H81_011426 [Sphagnurus paluster]
MSEKKQSPTVSPNKLAMSRALGAAFLNHQVEQLEKSVNGPASGNWRRRQVSPTVGNILPPANGGGRRPPMAPGIKVASREDSQSVRKARAPQGGGMPRSVPQERRRSSEEEKDDRKSRKDADVVVVDASVLVHALYKLKKWCREGREEVIIVPLEALNTLDLLKKGTSALAQRARAASRVLEAQVGTNPRIRVQQDEAFVLWDSIEFKDNSDSSAAAPQLPYTSPEWVRRTICCAQWEVEHAKGPNPQTIPKVTLAVLAPGPEPPAAGADFKPSSSPTPVPLPAPNAHANKHEPRSSGTLVAHWAARARISMLPVDPTAAPADDDARGGPKRAPARSRRTSDGSPKGHQTGLVERPPAVMAMMEIVAQPTKVVRVLARGEKLDPDP